MRSEMSPIASFEARRARDLLREACATLLPPPRVSVASWADSHRILDSSSPEPGPWRTDRTPYLREIMDSLMPGSPCERVVFMKAAQIGGTEVLLNFCGYLMHHAPAPALLIQPSVEMAKRFSRQRLDALIESTPALRELVKDPRSRDSGNTILAKEFRGGVLVMTGANSAVGLRSMPVRYLFLDEVDGYPLDVEALLIVELDGPGAECDHLIEEVEAIARTNGARYCRVSQNDEERLKFWAGRKAAFPAVGRISPDYLCMDGTIPTGQLPLVLRRMDEIVKSYGLRVANVFHAGDGNLHPLIMFDANVPGELERAEEFGAEILELCVEVGGTITGEHGVGALKNDALTRELDSVAVALHARVKQAWDPAGILNPGKALPRW